MGAASENFAGVLWSTDTLLPICVAQREVCCSRLGHGGCQLSFQLLVSVSSNLSSWPCKREYILVQ